MALGKAQKKQQGSLWVETRQLEAHGPNPFYEQINRILEKRGFDRRVERACRKYYAEKLGRPSLAPGIYFRCFLAGYFEGIDSERGIAYRVADSLSLRRFLGLSWEERTPDHSTLSKTRRLLSMRTHKAVFVWMLRLLAKEGLLSGKTVGIDATTLEANAALKSLVRRDNRASYDEHVAQLMKAEGVEAPTAEQRARFDRKRKKTLSNQEWVNPHDEEARITQLKDGRTHLAYKAEHAVDFDGGAILTVTVQPGDRGDCDSLHTTLCQAMNEVAQMAGQKADPDAVGDIAQVALGGVEEVVMDKGYHSKPVVWVLRQAELRTVIAEPDRGRQHWEGQEGEQEAVYANRRCLKSERGKALLRKRGEFLERSFAHVYDTGGMRRLHLRGKDNIEKRLLVHAAAFNLSLLLRKLRGAGTARQARDLREALCFWCWVLLHASQDLQS
jgi:transposase